MPRPVRRIARVSRVAARRRDFLTALAFMAPALGGCSHPRVFISIILPNCTGPLVALFLL